MTAAVTGDLVELPAGPGAYRLESADGVEARCVPGRPAQGLPRADGR